MAAPLDPVRRRHRTTLQAAGVLLVLLIAFFSTPLSSLGRTYYSTADLSQGTSLTRTQAGNRPKNPVLSDPAVQMQPWLMFNRDALAAGEIPLWNDWNASGVPHLANYQSAVFSPFSLPFYLLDFRWALLVTAFAKLFCLGLCAYCFFRAIDLRPLAALTGSVAFTFSGLNVLLVAYPHSAVVITLPAGLLCVEKAIRAREALLGWRDPGPQPASRGTRWVLALCLVFAGGLLCGHPEPFCFALLIIGAYTLARLVTAQVRHAHDSRGPAALLSLTAGFALAGLLGAGLAAVQIVPFLEYLAHSLTMATRLMVHMEISNWPLWIFPNTLGNPSTGHVMAYDLPYSNYEDVTTSYVGGLVVWLAALGALVARSRRFLFFAMCALVGIVYGYDLSGVVRHLGENLLTSAAPMLRSQVLGVFGLSGCAALCVDRLASSAAPTRKRTLVLAGVLAVAITLVAWLGAERLFARSLARGPTLSTVLELEDFAAQHYVWIACTLAVGVLALLTRLRVRRTTLRRACEALFVAALFAESGFLHRNYNTTIDDDAFFPRTPAIQAIQQTAGDRYMVVFGESCLPPDTNLPYGLRIASSYDALWVHEFDKMFNALFGSEDNWRTVSRVPETGLQLCGVEYVLADRPWNAIGTETDGGDSSESNEIYWTDISPGTVLSQTFIADKDDLRSIELRARSSTTESRNVRLVLEDLSTGTKVAADYLPVSILDALPGSSLVTEELVMAVVLSFPPLEDSLGKSYRLTVRAARKRPDDVLSIGTLTPQAVPAAAPGESYEIDDQPADGRLWFNRSYSQDKFEPVLHMPPYTLWHYTNSPTRFYCVDSAEIAQTDEEALRRIRAPDFDATRIVVLSAPVLEPLIEAPSVGPAQPASVMADTHQYTRLRIERSRPGYLFISRAHYPGWSARVNGVERELLRANVGLSAVQVEPGMNEIELRYDPQSFRLGLWLSGLCALALAIWTAGAARAARAARAA